MANSNHDPVITAEVWPTLSPPTCFRPTAGSAPLQNQYKYQ